VTNDAVIAGSEAGNRQPYASEHMLTASLGFARSGFDAQIEAAHVGGQYADFANTESPTADGQRGLLKAHTIWNATMSHTFRAEGATAFLSVKNLTDEKSIVDRTRGIQVSTPRLVQLGVKYGFSLGN
jgi:Fe(3+) dicitrate transport protein